MTIIEVDGVNSEPYQVDQIQIFAGMCAFSVVTVTAAHLLSGQRYSFVLDASQTVDNYCT